MEAYLHLLNAVISRGEDRKDRTGVGTVAKFGEHLELDMRDGFPAVTVKRLAFQQVEAELIAFLRGYENIEDFHAVGCNIWDGNALDSPHWAAKRRYPGDVGRIYGVQWRRWLSVGQLTALLSNRMPQPVQVDQLRNVVDSIKKDPHGRRHLVTAWNPGELDVMCLPPCHYAFQLNAGKDDTLDMLVHMRSVDLVLGLPFDMASYGLLLHVLAVETGRTPRKLKWSFGDAHVYRNHFEAATEMLKREPKILPELAWREGAVVGIDTLKPGDALLVGYDPHPAIKAVLNV